MIYWQASTMMKMNKTTNYLIEKSTWECIWLPFPCFHLWNNIRLEVFNARLYKEDLLELGAEITTREIYQQLRCLEGLLNHQARRDEIAAFCKELQINTLTGAGTFVHVPGSILKRSRTYNAIATTDVANPQTYLKKRRGNCFGIIRIVAELRV